MKDRELKQVIEVLKMIKEAYHKVPYGSTLDWYKVTELITELIPKRYISKIKNSTNTAKLEEYKTLVEFIINKADYPRKLAYLRYWSQASNVSSKPQPSPKTKLENFAFTGTIILLNLIWKILKTIKENNNIWRKVVLIGIILFIILKACHSTKKTDYSDTESSSQTEQEITPAESSEDYDSTSIDYDSI